MDVDFKINENINKLINTENNNKLLDNRNTIDNTTQDIITLKPDLIKTYKKSKFLN